MEVELKKIRHVGCIPPKTRIFLIEEEGFHWIDEQGGYLDLSEETLPLALQLAYQKFSKLGFRLVHFGTRYTLPERDEVGVSALFPHFYASYRSPTGKYFDQELGHMAYVDFASLEAKSLLKELEDDTRHTTP